MALPNRTPHRGIRPRVAVANKVDPYDENPTSTGRAETRFVAGSTAPGSGRRIGSTPEDRAGGNASYVPGYGVSSTQNSRESLTPQVNWNDTFHPEQNVQGPAPSGAAVAPETSRYIDPYASDNLTPTPNRESLLGNQGNPQEDSRIGAAAGTGKELETPYGTASSKFVPPDPNWQSDIVSKYPEIGQAGHPANAAFLKAFKADPAPERAGKWAEQVMKELNFNKLQN